MFVTPVIVMAASLMMMTVVSALLVPHPPLLQVLQGHTGVTAGPSGAGKSSLINALRTGRHREDSDGPSVLQLPLPLPSLQPDGYSPTRDKDNRGDDGCSEPMAVADELAASAGAPDFSSYLAVGDVSRMGRGRHTTRSVTLLTLPGVAGALSLLAAAALPSMTL